MAFSWDNPFCVLFHNLELLSYFRWTTHQTATLTSAFSPLTRSSRRHRWKSELYEEARSLDKILCLEHLQVHEACDDYATHPCPRIFVCITSKAVQKLTNSELHGDPGLNRKLVIKTTLVIFFFEQKMHYSYVVRKPYHKQNSSTHSQATLCPELAVSDDFCDLLMGSLTPLLFPFLFPQLPYIIYIDKYVQTNKDYDMHSCYPGT